MPILPTACVALQGARVRLEGGLLAIEHPDHPKQTIPIGQIGGLVLLGGIDCSTAALAALAERSIACSIATRTGRVRAVVGAPATRGLRARAAQHAVESLRDTVVPGTANPALVLARRGVVAKIDALLAILTQHRRTHALASLARPIALVRALRDRAAAADSIDRLRGFEGAAVARYFATLPELCRGELSTGVRTRRPPRDPFNAALSFGYSMLTAEMHATIVARGLEPALGLLHPPCGGRPSLALDLVEPLRHAIVDRLVLRAANRRELVAGDFEFVECPTPEEGSPDGEEIAPEAAPAPGVTACRLTDAGRRTFLSLYHAALEGSIQTREGSTRPTRSLLGDAVEAYEQALLELADAGFQPAEWPTQESA